MVRIVYLSKIIITLITVLVLMKINAGVSFAKSKSILSHLTNERVCEDATMGKNWDTRTSVSLYLQEAKLRGLSCGVKDSNIRNKTSLSDASICNLAVDYGRWTDVNFRIKFIKEAKRRGLTCGVQELSKVINLEDPCSLAVSATGYWMDYPPFDVYVR